MCDQEIIITVVGFVLSVLTYFAGVKRTEMRHQSQDREERIKYVFQSYMKLRKSNATGGYDGLYKAGIATLQSNNEVDDLIKRIVANGELHPLGSDRVTVFQDVNILDLFKYIAQNRINLLLTPIEKVIKDSGLQN